MSRSKTDIKAFLIAPEKWLAEQQVSGSSHEALQACALANAIQSEKQALKREKARKAEVAKDFKTVAPGSREHDQLVENMRVASDAFKEVERRLKETERALQEALAALVVDEITPPPLFHIPSSTSAAEPFKVRELAEGEYQAWSAFVRSLENVPNYCLPAWSGIIEEAFSHPTRVWIAVSNDGRILGGVPLTILNSRLFGRFAVSVPFFNYGGVLTRYKNVAYGILEHLKGVREQEAWKHIEIRTMQPGLALPSLSRKVSMILPLPSNTPEMDRRLGAKVRAQCKKAEAVEPRIRIGGLALLDDFYRVFSINMRDLGTPVYSKVWFRTILSRPAVRASLAVVYVQDKPVSAGFLLGHNRMLEIPWASTVRSANAMDCNMWMYRQILDYAITEGYYFFDFGRSTMEAGTYRFKKQWGAVPFEHHWYYILPEGGEVPAINPDNPKYQLAIAVWKRLPVWVTRLVGPSLVKYIP
ncbi:FemAB family XrtA/PEP-CTERM system-associated protein [Marinimicrobium sp. ARAG 43.8]|uniref:FemAB family XrtA/PEP-CTERM system-associated protein n=1 Tax=Marinimicrobium sp. ARAG 43.8 TaxID=3418719 RepID=UPI003CF20374